MSIIKKNLTSRFFQAPTDAITDIELSHGACRVYCYLISRPDNWKVNNKDIKEKLGIRSNDTVAEYFKNLLSAGWITREKAKNAKSQLTGGYNYTIYDEKQIIPDSEKSQIRKNPKSGKSTNHINIESNTNTDSNNYNKDTYVSSAPGQEQLVQPTKSFSPQTEQIIKWWNTLFKATKHTRSDTKVYQRSAMYLDRLLNGTPILQIKSGKPTKNLLHFAEKFNLSEDLIQKKLSKKQIKDIIQKVHDDNLDSHKKHSLESVLWNSFAGKAGGFSHFLHKAAQLNVPEKYIDLSKKLAEIAEVNLPEHTLLDWAKDLQDYLSENGGSVEQVRNILNWYTYYIENKYTPKARDMQEFIYKLPRIDAAMQRSEDKEQKPSNWYREKKENRTKYSF